MKDFPQALSHGPLTRVADGVHTIRGAFRMGPGMVIARTMAVLQVDEGLVILNAVRLSDAAQEELDALGTVKHLIKLSDSHSIDEPFYADRYAPEVWALKGAKLQGVTATRELGPQGPVPGGQVVDYQGASGWRECAYLVPMGGGTLVTCDSIQNCIGEEGTSLLARVMTPLMGFKGGVVVPPMWRRFQKVNGARVTEVLSGIAELSFDNLITGHGPAVVGGADARVRSAIERASG